VVTELATNLVKHTAGAGGELVFSPMIDGAAVGLDILSLDQGPGIVNIAESLRDGHSTAGSLGTGLGAIRRQSALFDIFSAPGHGTALFSRLWQASPAAAADKSAAESSAAATFAMLVGGVCLPVRGEQACGDAWAMKNGPGTTLFLLADGLGHGPDAAAAANLAVEIFEKTPTSGPEVLLHLIDVGLRGTRGAAVVVAEVDHNQCVVRFAGVGNLVALIVSAGVPHNLISHYGTAGVETPKIQAFTLPLPDHSLFILHSDGIATRWSLDDYPGLSRKHPALIAGILYRDHQRLRDDSTVVVARSALARPAA
jgi:hypothetical protein